MKLNKKEFMGALGSGSYNDNDILFLLKEVNLKTTSIKEKERLIQSGIKHYSEMISNEDKPSIEHEQLFQKVLEENAIRMASDIIALANGIKTQMRSNDIILISLVRAGVPIGVLLKHELESLGITCHHYGISIIRDRGIDLVALRDIVLKHGKENIIFVDGWTGKGAISDQLRISLSQIDGFESEPNLLVLTDPCGKAWMAASSEDWIIPSGILGATVSGLISRSIWNNTGGLHGCMIYKHLQDADRSIDFINQIKKSGASLISSNIQPSKPWTTEQRDVLQLNAKNIMNDISSSFKIKDINRIKPGIAEATRAVMRRVPEHVLVRDKKDKDVELLTYLTDRIGISVKEVGDKLGPYRALTIIKRVK